MSKNVIFCWSGTGNCLTMAKIIAGELGDTDIIMARKKPARTDVTDAERVGFVFPCHGGGAPVDFLEYMKDVKISPNAYTFAVSQSASYAGIGLHKLSQIHRLDYWKAVHHQCTCIWLFPHWIMIPPMPASLATKLADKKAVSIAKDVLAGARTEKKPPKNPLNVIENAGWSTVTKLVTRGFKVSDKCIGCGQCVELCPRENIKLENGRAVIGRNCIQCLGCLQFCPQEAISITKLTQIRKHYTNKHVKAKDLSDVVIHIN